MDSHSGARRTASNQRHPRQPGHAEFAGAANALPSSIRHMLFPNKKPPLTRRPRRAAISLPEPCLTHLAGHFPLTTKGSYSAKQLHLPQFFLADTCLSQNFKQCSLWQISFVKRHHDPSFRLWVVVNMMAAFNPIQNETLLFKNFDNFLRRKRRQFRHTLPLLGYTPEFFPLSVSLRHALSSSLCTTR